MPQLVPKHATGGGGKSAARAGRGSFASRRATLLMLDSLAPDVHNIREGGEVGELAARWFAIDRGGMSEILQSPEARLAILSAVTATLAAVGIYVVAKVRRSFAESGPGVNDLITNFRELHSEGELTDEEYRTIKATLAARLQQQLKGRNQAG